MRELLEQFPEVARNIRSRHNFTFNQDVEDPDPYTHAVDIAFGACVRYNTTCCGVSELSRVGEGVEPQHIAHIIATVPKDRLIVYYGVRQSVKEKLEKLGFKQVGPTWHNSNSGNDVYTLHYYKDWE